MSRGGERGDGDGCRHSGAAVRTDPAVVHAVLAEQPGDLVVRPECAVAVEHGAAGQIFGAGDVAGNRVDRLDVTLEALRRAGV